MPAVVLLAVGALLIAGGVALLLVPRRSIDRLQRRAQRKGASGLTPINRPLFVIWASGCAGPGLAIVGLGSLALAQSARG